MFQLIIGMFQLRKSELLTQKSEFGGQRFHAVPMTWAPCPYPQDDFQNNFCGLDVDVHSVRVHDTELWPELESCLLN